MRDIWFLITDHKGIVKILAILIAIFCVVSMSALLGDSRSIIEDFLREQCALYYPTAVEAECNGILTADFNANEYRVDFSLKDTEDQQLTGITVVYHLSTKQCELM